MHIGTCSWKFDAWRGLVYSDTVQNYLQEYAQHPNYLNAEYFGFLRERGLAHVWQMGYYMPPIFGLYDRYADQLTADVVIRLHGPDREGMDERAGKDWSRILEPRDADLDALATVLEGVRVRRQTAWVFANNHFEGCAPLTIDRIKARMGSKHDGTLGFPFSCHVL